MSAPFDAEALRAKVQRAADTHAHAVAIWNRSQQSDEWTDAKDTAINARHAWQDDCDESVVLALLTERDTMAARIAALEAVLLCECGHLRSDHDDNDSPCHGGRAGLTPGEGEYCMCDGFDCADPVALPPATEPT